MTARLLVGSNLVGCFTGNGGKVLSEATQATGAIVQLFRGIEIQNRESQGDSIVEVCFISFLNLSVIVENSPIL